MAEYEFARSGDWLTVKPRFPGPAGANRADRALIARLLRHIQSGLPVSLEAGADARLRLGDLHVFVERWTEILDPRNSACSLGLTEGTEFGWHLLHDLSPSQRQSLYNGRPLPFSTLPGSLQTWLRNELALKSLAEDIVIDETGELDDDFGGRISIDTTSFSLPPEELAYSQVEAKVEYDVRFERAREEPGGLKEVDLCDAPTLATSVDARLKPLPVPDGTDEDETPPSRFTHVRPVVHRSVTFRLRFRGGYSLISGHHDAQFPAPDRYVLPHQLPKAYQDLLLRLQREAPKDVTPDDDGTSP